MMSVKKGYKQTEVGVIPEDWEVRNVGSLTSKVGSGITPLGGNDNYLEYGRPFVRSQNIGWGDLRLDDLVYIDEQTHQSFSSTELTLNDVLLNITGASIGRSSIVDEQLKGGNVNQHVCIIRVLTETASPGFINYVLLSTIGQKQIDSFQAGGNREGLNFTQVRSIETPLPSLAEQSAIATALSDADALIESLEQLIAKKHRIKQGAMQELLTGKRRLPGHKGEWKIQRIEEAADIRSGGTPATNRPEFWNGDVSWCTPTDITSLRGRKYLSKTERAITLAGLNSSSADLIPPYSVIITSRATIGDCAINTIPISTNQGFKNLIPFESTDFNFLYYTVATKKKDFLKLCAGSTFLEIGKNQLKAVELSLPPLAEQTAIAEVLSDMDAEIEALEAKLTKARKIKQGMMRELLTGRIRLV